MLSEEWRIPLSKKSLESVWGQGRVGGEGVILAQPTTYMNLSGQAVSRLMAYFKLSPEDLVIIHDDLDVPLWRLKIVERGGPGGHRGILDIIATLHTEEFLRVKLGIGRPRPGAPHGKVCAVAFPGRGGGKCGAVHRTGGPGGGPPDAEGRAVAQNRFHGEPVEFKRIGHHVPRLRGVAGAPGESTSKLCLYLTASPEG